MRKGAHRVEEVAVQVGLVRVEANHTLQAMMRATLQGQQQTRTPDFTRQTMSKQGEFFCLRLSI